MTAETLKSPAQQTLDEGSQIIRGDQAGTPFNVAFVGGGEACHNLLQILDKERLSRLKMKILGVADTNPEAPGLVYAKELNLFTTSDFQDLYTLKKLNFIFELTGSTNVREAIRKTKPPEISLVGHRGARLLFDLVQIEVEKTELDKKRREQDEKEKKHTQIILDSLPYNLMVVNQDMTVNMVNKTFQKNKKLNFEDTIKKHCYEIRYGLDRPCAEYGRTCYLEEVKKNGEIISTIHEFVTNGGETCFEVITVSPIFDEHGEIIQLLEASRDVTDRIKLEREVQKSNVFFQNVIQSTVDGIVVVDTKGNVLIFNQGMENLTGYTAREIMEQGHLSSFYNIDVAKENMCKMRSDQYGPEGKLNPTSMSVISKTGEEIPVTLSASIITIDDREIGSVGVFTDMREVLKMRKDLEDAHLQLIQSEKIASVGRMAAGVAHEINNPLAGIMIYAELLKEALKDDKNNLSDIQEVIDQTLRCKKIVAELLEFSRQTVGKISSFSLEEMIEKTLNILINQVIFQNIEVIKDIKTDIPEMAGDIGQLQQVFSNLFRNAADAMGGRGKLTINARYDTDKNQFGIRVCDTGPGVPEELRSKIFDIFFTTKPVGKGTGLGLSICKKIIELHGGNLMVECPPEGGTTFIVELPLGFVEKPEEEALFI
ncbi:MAG: PAS domain S-box protein [Deltaproteobacteria bacterium]|nr:PAS domain S-box protein [Deltaproteobacteria bacterium]